MVVRRRHRHHLLGADLRADRAEARRVADRAGGDDRALALHQPRHGGDRPDPARVGEREVGALEVVGGQRVVTRPRDQVAEGVEELREREAAGVADDRHHQRAPAVLALDVDGDAEVHGAGVDHVRLAVDLAERARHDRHLLGRRAGDRVGDQVGEGDAVAGLLELLAAGVERRDGDRAERGGGRDRPRLVHVAREHRARALEQRASSAAGAPFSAASTSAFEIRPAGPGALDLREVDAERVGHPGGHRRDLDLVGDPRRSARLRARGGGRLGRLRAVAPFDVVMRAMTWPTVTVSPAWARISSIVPEAGAGTSASTLSVEISTIVSSSATGSPGCLAHSRIVPSDTDSPIAGMTISTVSPLAVGLRLGRRRRRRAVTRGDLGEHRADPDRVALGGVDLDHGAGDRGGHLGVDLVGGDLDQDLVFGDLIAFLFVPFQDGALGDRVTHLRHGHFHRGVDRHPGFRPYRVPARPQAGAARRLTDHERDAPGERADAAHDRDHHGEPERDHALPDGDDAQQRHHDPADAVRPPEDHADLLVPVGEPHREQAEVDRRSAGTTGT